jgi:hypothetical protein
VLFQDIQKDEDFIDSAKDLKILRFTQDFFEESMIHPRFTEDLKILSYRFSKILSDFPRFSVCLPVLMSVQEYFKTSRFSLTTEDLSNFKIPKIPRFCSASLLKI